MSSSVPGTPSPVDPSLLAEAQRLARIGWWEWQVAADRITASEGLYELYGVDPDTFKGTFAAFIELVHPEDRQVILGLVQRALTDPAPFEVVHRLVRPDGQVRWTRGRARIKLGPDGSPERLYGTAQDITEQKDAEVRLKESEERWRALVENLPDYILNCDTEGRIVFINRFQPGFNEDQVLGKPMLDYILPEEKEKMSRVFRRVLKSGTPEHYEIGGMGPFGVPAWYLCRMGVVRRDGRIEGVSIIACDITEKKRAEEEVRLLQAIALGINDASDLEGSLRVTLERICQTTGWEFGQVFFPSEEGDTLRAGPFYDATGGQFGEFREASERQAFGYGAGLPGRAWALAKPCWVNDAASDESFLRSTVAAAVGIRAGFAIPALAGRDVAAILEFFVRSERRMDERFVQIVTAVAAQIGGLIRRKQAEKDLERTRAHFEAFMDNSPALAWIKSEDLRYLFVNKPWERFFGRAMKDVVNKDDLELWPSAVAEELRSNDRRVLAAGQAIHADERVPAPDGGEHEWIVYKFPLVGNAGEKLLGGFALDVTERNRALERLRDSEQEFRVLVDGVQDYAIFMLSPEGTVTSWNSGAERLSGYTAAEMIGRPLETLFADRRSSPESFRLLERARTEGRCEAEVRLRSAQRAEGLLANLAIDRIGQGEGGFAVVARDVTEERRVEEGLRRSEKSLQQRNFALSEILGQIEMEKRAMNEAVLGNVERLLIPNLQKLRTRSSRVERRYLDLLERNLREMTGSFGSAISSKHWKLTPKEIEICNMIKAGLTSKDISTMLNVSPLTVETHRTKIRKKLGLQNKEVNLTTYLQGI
ncbi:MAG: hypothetical protein MOGMAGMI_00464 [Candidatus Omnitrophica bacterium]|nr:hypothetical protein [Candidatus Omnitrophota bacterium]